MHTFWPSCCPFHCRLLPSYGNSSFISLTQRGQGSLLHLRLLSPLLAGISLLSSCLPGPFTFPFLSLYALPPRAPLDSPLRSAALWWQAHSCSSFLSQAFAISFSPRDRYLLNLCSWCQTIKQTALQSDPCLGAYYLAAKAKKSVIPVKWNDEDGQCFGDTQWGNSPTPGFMEGFRGNYI